MQPLCNNPRPLANAFFHITGHVPSPAFPISRPELDLRAQCSTGRRGVLARGSPWLAPFGRHGRAIPARLTGQPAAALRVASISIGCSDIEEPDSESVDLPATTRCLSRRHNMQQIGDRVPLPDSSWSPCRNGNRIFFQLSVGEVPAHDEAPRSVSDVSVRIFVIWLPGISSQVPLGQNTSPLLRFLYHVRSTMFARSGR